MEKYDSKLYRGRSYLNLSLYLFCRRKRKDIFREFKEGILRWPRGVTVLSLFTLFSLCFRLFSLFFTLFSLFFTLFSLFFWLFSLFFTLFSLFFYVVLSLFLAVLPLFLVVLSLFYTVLSFFYAVLSLFLRCSLSFFGCSLSFLHCSLSFFTLFSLFFWLFSLFFWLFSLFFYTVLSVLSVTVLFSLCLILRCSTKTKVVKMAVLVLRYTELYRISTTVLRNYWHNYENRHFYAVPQAIKNSF